MDILTALIIYGIGVVASFVGVIASSGGLISVIGLMVLGLPPRIAIATNKLGGYGFFLGRAIKFWRSKYVRWDYVIPLIIVMAAGSFVGANILLKINEEVLFIVVGIILLLALIPLVLYKNLGLIEKQRTSKRHKVAGYVGRFFNSIYAGMFGAGAGFTARLVSIGLFRFSHLESIATDSVVLLFSRIVPLLVFAFAGIIDYSSAAILFAGMITGGYLGSHVAIKKGNEWIRWIFIIFVFAAAIKFIFF